MIYILTQENRFLINVYLFSDVCSIGYHRKLSMADESFPNQQFGGRVFLDRATMLQNIVECFRDETLFGVSVRIEWYLDSGGELFIGSRKGHFDVNFPSSEKHQDNPLASAWIFCHRSAEIILIFHTACECINGRSSHIKPVSHLLSLLSVDDVTIDC